MAATQFTEGLKTVRGVLDNVKNFFPALLQVDELLKSCDAAEQMLPQIESLKLQKVNVEDEIAGLKASIPALQATVNSFNNTLRQLQRAGNLDSYIVEKEKREAELDTAIAEKEKSLKDATEAFEQFKAVHAMK